MNKIRDYAGNLGEKTHAGLVELAKIGSLVRDFFFWSFVAPLKGKKGMRREQLFKHLVFTGNESVGIICMVSASIGAVLALQGAYQLKMFGAIIYTGALVSVSIARELGPIMTSVIVAGRVGASITAELGTMKVQEEVDALTTMGIPPIPYLVVPRMVAISIMLPVLTIVSFAVGMLGGYLVGVVMLGINSSLYLQASFDALTAKDMWSGLAKSYVFSILVGVIACYCGMGVKGGADGVGRATTQSVVASIISIIIADGVCTAVIFALFP